MLIISIILGLSIVFKKKIRRQHLLFKMDNIMSAVGLTTGKTIEKLHKITNYLHYYYTNLCPILDNHCI